MRTLTFTFLASLTLLFSSCMKHANDYEPAMGEALNTWTFKEGSKTYAGVFLVSPVLHTTLQSNNTYTLEMTGIHKGSGQLLTMAISLSDLDFNVNHINPASMDLIMLLHLAIRVQQEAGMQFILRQIMIPVLS